MRIAAFRAAALFVVTLPALAGWTIHGPDGGSVKRLAYDPADPSIVYAAASNGLFRSADGGRHWTGATPLLGTSMLDVAVAKSDPNIVFAASPDGLYASSDRGLHWSVAQTDGAFHVALSAQNARVVYSVSFAGPVLSSDGGVTFGSRGSGLPAGLASAIAVDPQNDATVYVAFPSAAGVYKSTDHGAHWMQANSGLTAPQLFSLAIDPAEGKTLYAAGRAAELFKSTDGAASWTPLPLGFGELTCSDVEAGAGTPSTLLAATTHGALRSTDGGASWHRGDGIDDAETFAVASDPANVATFLAALGTHVVRTTDGGATRALSDAGLSSFSTRGIATDPHDDAVVYAAGPAGLARSADRGRSWTIATAIAPIRVAVDANASTLYVASGNTVERSVDGGVTWTPFGDGLPAVAPQFLAADPQSSGTLYAVVNGAVYKTSGAAWVSRNDGLPGSLDYVTIDPHHSATLYAGGPDGVFKSADGGAHWAAANNGFTGLNSVGLAVDPFDSRHLFAWSPTRDFESTDEGASWSPAAASAATGSSIPPRPASST